MLFSDAEETFLFEVEPPREFEDVAAASDLPELYNSRCSQFFLLRTFLNSLMSVEGEDFEGENLMWRMYEPAGTSCPAPLFVFFGAGGGGGGGGGQGGAGVGALERVLNTFLRFGAARKPPFRTALLGFVRGARGAGVGATQASVVLPSSQGSAGSPAPLPPSPSARARSRRAPIASPEASTAAGPPSCTES